MLLNRQVQCNTQVGILKDFDTHFTAKGLYIDNVSFRDLVLQINQKEPTEQFAKTYLQSAKKFIEFAGAFRGS